MKMLSALFLLEHPVYALPLKIFVFKLSRPGPHITYCIFRNRRL